MGWIFLFKAILDDSCNLSQSYKYILFRVVCIKAERYPKGKSFHSGGFAN